MNFNTSLDATWRWQPTDTGTDVKWDRSWFLDLTWNVSQAENEKDHLTLADRNAIAVAIQAYRADLEREFSRRPTSEKRGRRRRDDGQGQRGEGEGRH